MLSSSGVAPNTPETHRALEEKHPFCLPPPKLTIPFTRPSLVAERGHILSCIKSFPKGTYCGRDGLHTQHLLDFMSGGAIVVTIDVMVALSPVVNLWLQGRCLHALAKYIARAPFTLLLKLNNDI